MVLIAVLGLAALGSGAGASDVARRHAPCPTPGAHVQAADSRIVAYFVRGPDTMFVCDRASGFREEIGPVDVFPAPAVGVSGELYVYGDILPGTGEGIEAGRLLPVNSGSPPSGAALIAGDTGRDAKLITVKLKSDGAYVWMTCEIKGPLKAYLASGPHARCQHPGVPIWVYKHDANQSEGNALSLLAFGNTIDPQSLRLQGSNASWRQHGRTRTAKLD
jgi:hypothetical protein